MATLLQDNFDRTNSTTTIGAPQVGPTPTVLSGVGGINTNLLYAPTATLIAVYDLATVDVELQADAVNTNNTQQMGFVFGGASTTDHWLIQFTLQGTELYRSNPGGYQLYQRHPKPMTNATTTVKASHKAGVFRAYVGGVQVLEWFADVPITSTRHGVRITSASNIRVDNLLGVDAPTITDAEPATTIPALAYLNGAADAAFAYRGRNTKALDLAGVS